MIELTFRSARSLAARVLLCAAVASVAGCAEDRPVGAPRVEALSGAGGSICTYTPDDWSSRCASHVGDARLCRALARARTDDDRERAALALNLAATPALGTLHFTHGARVLIGAADSLRISPRSDPLVQLAVHDANRAFDGCIDHAVLDDWVTTPVCGRPAVDAV